MTYYFAKLVDPLISEGLPRPKSMLAPLWRFNVKDHPAVKAQLSFMQTREQSAVGAATTLFKDGKLVDGSDFSVRNTHTLQTAPVPLMQGLLQEMATLAWGNFSFSGPGPLPGQTQVLIYREGGFFVPHYDDSRGDLHEGGRNAYRNTPQRSLTCLIYLNGDFEGGEIVFNHILDANGQPLVIKPTQGDVVAFPPHEAYTHEVRKVTKGIRYNVSQWFDDSSYFKCYGPLNARFRQNTEQYADTIWSALTNDVIAYKHRLLSSCVVPANGHGVLTDVGVSRSEFLTLAHLGGSQAGSLVFPRHNIVSQYSPWNITQFRNDMPRYFTPASDEYLVFKSVRTYELPVTNF